jgi:hypothetical protein
MDHRKAKRHKIASQYMLGELSALERVEFEEHYFECSECAEDVRALVTISFTTPAVIADMPQLEFESGSKAFPRLSWLAWLWSWRPPAAFLLAPSLAAIVLTAFASFEFARLRNQPSAQAVSTIHLLPVARGADSEVPGDRAGSFIALTADVPEIASEWKWRILDAESKTALLEGSAANPPGGSLTLLVPVSKLPAGRYVLTLRDAALAPEFTNEVRYGFRMH